MIKDKIQDAINKQIAREMYSSNLYLSMAGYYSSINLNGFANWMRVQAQEEMVHALKFFDYLIDRQGQPVIGKLEAPPSQWDSALAAMEASLHHEQLISEAINELANLAISEGDHATNILLQWFVTEQVEEEATVNDIVTRLKMMEGFTGGLYMMDNELKARQFVPPGRGNQ